MSPKYTSPYHPHPPYKTLLTFPAISSIYTKAISCHIIHIYQCHFLPYHHKYTGTFTISCHITPKSPVPHTIFCHITHNAPVPLTISCHLPIIHQSPSQYTCPLATSCHVTHNTLVALPLSCRITHNALVLCRITHNTLVPLPLP